MKGAGIPLGSRWRGENILKYIWQRSEESSWLLCPIALASLILN